MGLTLEQQQKITDLSMELGCLLTKGKRCLVTAESCSGGWIAQAITEIAGSSVWFNAGLVTYSNHAKEQLLGVDPLLIEEHGAVSQEVVEAMAFGAANKGFGSISVAVSGIAGPGGGSSDKPVGTVWIGWSIDGCIGSQKYCFKGDRQQVRFQTVMSSLSGLIGRLNAL